MASISELKALLAAAEAATKATTPPAKTQVAPKTGAVETAGAELTRLRAENEAMKAKLAAKSTMSFKVSEKGALSIYGLGRFPVTLYRSQVERLLAAKPAIEQFIADNSNTLIVKS